MPFIVADEVLRERVPWPSRFPRSARYDARWQFDNAMGPNPLWLLESLADVMPLEVGSRVLDLGAGVDDRVLPLTVTLMLGRSVIAREAVDA